MSHPLADLTQYITTTDTWGLSRFTLTDLSASVTHLTFAAHENTYNEGSTYAGAYVPPTNHWTLFLALDDQDRDRHRYVHLEIAPNEPGVPGMVILESTNASTNADIPVPTTKQVTVPVSVSVADVLSLIIHNKRDTYVFDPCGEGCRYWFYNVVGDFVRAGYVRADEARRVREALGVYWPFPEGTGPVERGMRRGVFPRLGSE